MARRTKKAKACVKASRPALDLLLRQLRLGGMVSHLTDVTRTAEAEGWTFETFLSELCEIELAERGTRRVARLLRDSRLPAGKTPEALDLDRLPDDVSRRVRSLFEGDFLAGAVNILAFGMPGRGKTHLVSAIGHALVRKGHKVLFRPAALLVQELLAAKRDFRLEAVLKRLDRYEAVIIDDIGYVQQSRDEMEVLFTFLAARYERRSVLMTSNLVFSQWDRIFKDPMTTAAAIDRLVHHSIVLNLTGPSIRNLEAKAARDALTDLESRGADESPAAVAEQGGEK